MRRLLLLLLALLLAACPTTSDDDDSAVDDDDVVDDDDAVDDDDSASDDDDAADDDDSAADDDDAVDDDDSAAEDAFERFRVVQSYGPCPPDTDCNGFIEIAADGLLRVDILGELPEQIHESKVPENGLAKALPALIDPELVAILASDELPCMVVDDVYELMEVTLDGVAHDNETTMCDLAPIVAAREAMDDLAATFGP